MRSVPLRPTGLSAPNVVLGVMRIADSSDAEIRHLVRAARDAGIDFFDRAAVYGHQHHHCEERFAQALRLSPSDRAELTIQTKAGILPEGCDSSYEHLVASAEKSLRALRTDYLDVLLIHRPDAWSSPTRWPAPSTISRRPARCGRSASPTTPSGSSSCSDRPSGSRWWRTSCNCR
ncbi:MAG: aldo/keto reductase [Micropruina sp.]